MKKACVFSFLLGLSACLSLVSCGHQHSFAEGWQTDDTQHWKAVNCGHPEAIRYEAHVPDGGRLVGDAFVYTCTVCGREYTDAEQTARLEKGTQALLETANAYLNKKGFWNTISITAAARHFPHLRRQLSIPICIWIAPHMWRACITTFGIRVMPESYGSQNTKNYTKYAKESLGKSPDVIGYYETQDYATEAEQDAMIEKLKALLRPGDIIVYRRGSEGWKRDGSYYYQSHLLASLFAYRMYAVLRP